MDPNDVHEVFIDVVAITVSCSKCGVLHEGIDSEWDAEELAAEHEQDAADGALD